MNSKRTALILAILLLKSGTSDSQKSWFRVGGYKMLANQVGGIKWDIQINLPLSPNCWRDL